VAEGVHPDDEGRRLAGVLRWSAAALVIVCGHVAGAMVVMGWEQPKLSAGEPPAAVMISLAPVPTASRPVTDHQAKDVTQREATSSRVSSENETAVTAVADMPRPEVASPGIDLPVTAQQGWMAAALMPVPKSKPQPSRPARKAALEKPTAAQQRKPLPAPPSQVPQISEAAASPSADATFGAGIAPSEIPSTWKSLLIAHLNRYKHYPAAARGVEGVALLTFTMDRSGAILGCFIARSSGSTALDEETLAMVQRAEPLPQIPPEITGNSLQFTVPVRFNVR